MKKSHIVIAALIAPSMLNAATTRVEDVNNTLFTLTGPTITIEGSEGRFVSPAGTRWTVPSGVTVGTDRVAEVKDPADSSDFYINFGATALGAIPVASNRYVEIFYSTSGDWVGAATTHAFRLGTTNEAAAFSSFINRGLIPAGTATGPQSIIIDLDQEQDGDWTGNWSNIRWDFFNDAGNTGGETFTMDKIVFGNTLTVVPEPSSTALLGLGGLALTLRRRRG